jgi:hypothetical protein
MARPEANIDWEMVNSYLLRQCDGVGIAGLLGIHPNTLYERCQQDNNISFSEYSAQKKGEGKEILRAKQYDTAIGDPKKNIQPNVSMQIWLGKQYLGQRDKNELTGADGKDLNPLIKIEIIDSAEQVKKDDSSSE